MDKDKDLREVPDIHWKTAKPDTPQETPPAPTVSTSTSALQGLVVIFEQSQRDVLRTVNALVTERDGLRTYATVVESAWRDLLAAEVRAYGGVPDFATKCAAAREHLADALAQLTRVD